MDTTTTHQTQPQPLADRPTNTHLAQNTNTEKSDDMKKPVPVESTQKQQAYVSPSDEIMSPCSKKLSDIKGKRFKNAGKPQSLLAKLGKKNIEQSSLAANSDKEGAQAQA